MALLRYKSRGTKVKELQELLNEAGYDAGVPDGIFGRGTERAVKKFQKDNGLDDDGVVGNMTWLAFTSKEEVIIYDSLQKGFVEYHLKSDEYFKEVVPKDAIFLHHTAGGARPDYVIDGWERDKSRRGGSLRVGTAFVIGGKTTGAANFDGVIYRAFKAKYWAHHLGLKRPRHKKWQNGPLNAKSIGIEICNYGALQKNDEGYYAQFGERKLYVPDEDVLVFDEPFRGRKYYQKYTEKQIEATKFLILELCKLFSIKLPKHHYTREWFDLKYDALHGAGGLWSHVSVREDKWDCFPQPELIDMLNTLYDELNTSVEPNPDDETSVVDTPVVDTSVVETPVVETPVTN